MTGGFALAAEKTATEIALRVTARNSQRFCWTRLYAFKATVPAKLRTELRPSPEPCGQRWLALGEADRAVSESSPCNQGFQHVILPIGRGRSTRG